MKACLLLLLIAVGCLTVKKDHITETKELFQVFLTEEQENRELYRTIDPKIEAAAKRIREEGPKAIADLEALHKLAYETLAFAHAHKNATRP